MSVSVRTNLATNPNAATAATNWAAVAGTGGAAAVAWNGGAGYNGVNGFARVTWSAATTAVSGGVSYSDVGLAASTAYAMQMWVRSSKSQTLTLTATFQDATNTVVNTVVGAAVTVTAGVMTQLTVTGTSGLAVTNVVLTAAAAGTGVVWAIGDTLDGDMAVIEAAAAVGTPFDGATKNTTGLPTNKTYAWAGTANASTSTETTRTVALAASGLTLSSGRPYAQVVISDAGSTAAYTVQLQRVAGGFTMNVQGAANRTFTDSDVINDYATALGVSETYSLVWNGAVVASVTVTVSSSTSWLSDPLQPDKGIPVKLDGSNPGYLTMSADSLKTVTYPAAGKLSPILGSNYPALLGGQPVAQTGMPLVFFSDDKATADSFRSMVLGTPVLLLQALPGTDPLPPVGYMSREVKEQDVNRWTGGTIASWIVTASLVQAVTQAVTSGNVLYSDVQSLISTANTYAQVQTKAAATTYLDWQKNPKIWSTL